MKKIIALLLAALLTVSAGVCALAEPVTLTDPLPDDEDDTRKDETSPQTR